MVVYAEHRALAWLFGRLPAVVEVQDPCQRTVLRVHHHCDCKPHNVGVDCRWCDFGCPELRLQSKGSQCGKEKKETGRGKVHDYDRVCGGVPASNHWCWCMGLCNAIAV